MSNVNSPSVGYKIQTLDNLKQQEKEKADQLEIDNELKKKDFEEIISLF